VKEGVINSILKSTASVLRFTWRYDHTYKKWSQFLKDAEKWEAQKIQHWQLQRLKQIVSHAFNNTRGYNQLYREKNISPDDIHCLGDIKRLPFVTKQLIRDNLKDFSINKPGAKYVTTGGSTGIPFGFYSSQQLEQTELAFMHAGWSRFGFKPGLLSAVLRGGYVGSSDKPFRWDSYNQTFDISTYHLTSETLAQTLAALKGYKFHSLQAYPSCLNIFCKLLKDLGLPAPHFDIICLGSENLYPWQLEIFKQTFPQAKFVSVYGHAEKTILGHWCEKSETIHSWPFYGLLEVLDQQGEPVEEGAEGEIVGTSLHGFNTPFVRYKTMDHAINGAKSCSHCGRSFHLLNQITGRAHEFIVSKEGRKVSMTAINMHDDLFDNIKAFQFYQKSPGLIEFHYIPKASLTESEKAKITEGLRTKIGEDFKLSLKPVESIKRSPSGKYSFLKTEI